MKRVIRIGLLLVIVAAVAAGWLGHTTATQAQTGGGYDLTWNTLDGGGGTSSGGGYSLSGTIGQPDAGELTGGTYSLKGGFWAGVQSFFDVFLPLIRR